MIRNKLLLFVLCLTISTSLAKKKLFPGDGVDATYQYKESEIDEEIERLKATEFKDLKKLEEHRNKAWGCYYIVKNKLVTSDSKIANMAKNGTMADKMKIEKYLASDWFQNCLGRIDTDLATKFLEDLANENKVDLKPFDETIGYTDNFDEKKEFELDQFHALIFNYYEDLDNQFRRINGEEENYFKKKYDIEPKIWGMSLSKMDTTTKIGIMIGITSLIISFFYFAYKKLFTEKESVLEAAKKNKKKRKTSKSKTE